MIFDFNQDLPTLAPFDICIAGGGVAGLILSLKLAGRGLRVLVLEAGGLEPSAESQEFYRGTNSGTENLPLHETRIRALGGSSNHWGGWCRPFDPIDFRRHDYLPDGSWPVSEVDLEPYQRDAIGALAVTRASGADLDLLGSAGTLRTIRMMFSSPPARLGQLYRSALERLPNVVVVVNAVVANAEFDRERGRVAAFLVQGNFRRQPVPFTANAFVLAMGTVENVRALLLWNRDLQNRLGNTSGALGRYYLQHLHQELGRFVLTRNDSSDSRVGDGPRAFFATTAAFATRTGTGAVRLYSDGIACDAVLDGLRNVATAAACSTVVAGQVLYGTGEQRPNAESRISLTDEVDSFGRAQVRLDWRTNESDAATLREAAFEFGRYLARTDIGRLKVDERILSGETPLARWTDLESAPGAAGHQMGGARMSPTAATGVVDRHCRVWGSQNLYVAGSAAFPTGSHTTPTFTIAQLALRLADHLADTLRP